MSPEQLASWCNTGKSEQARTGQHFDLQLAETSPRTPAKKSITITIPESLISSLDIVLEEFEVILKTHFTELCGIAKYGNAIVVTGQEIAIDNLKALWSTMDFSGKDLSHTGAIEPIMSESTPSLTDAMTYHLINSKNQRLT